MKRPLGQSRANESSRNGRSGEAGVLLFDFRLCHFSTPKPDNDNQLTSWPLGHQDDVQPPYPPSAFLPRMHALALMRLYCGLTFLKLAKIEHDASAIGQNQPRSRLQLHRNVMETLSKGKIGN